MQQPASTINPSEPQARAKMCGNAILFGHSLADVIEQHSLSVEAQTCPTERNPAVIEVRGTSVISLYMIQSGFIVQQAINGVLERRFLVRPKDNRADINGLESAMSAMGSRMSGMTVFVAMIDDMRKRSVTPIIVRRWVDKHRKGSRAEFVISGGMAPYSERMVTIREFTPPGPVPTVTIAPLTSDTVRAYADKYPYNAV